MKTPFTKTTILYTILGFALFLLIKETCFKSLKEGLDTITHNDLLSYVLSYLIIGLPIFVSTYLIVGGSELGSGLGLKGSCIKALIVSLIFASPMLVGGLAVNGIASGLNWQNVVAGTIVAGFVEELYYRGFLFGMLYRFAKVRFIPAVLVGAVLFALAHAYQSQDVMKLMGILGITFMGAGLYSWLYVEWDYNLWVPILLHTFMNLAWKISDLGDTALGGLTPNLLRVGTIFLAIAGTIISRRKSGEGIKEKVFAR